MFILTIMKKATGKILDILSFDSLQDAIEEQERLGTVMPGVYITLTVV